MDLLNVTFDGVMVGDAILFQVHSSVLWHYCMIVSCEREIKCFISAFSDDVT